MEALEEERESLQEEQEQIERAALNPRQGELEEIDIERYESRLEKIEQLQSLIQSGEIESIKERLLQNEEVNEELGKLYNRKREIEQELRKLNRKLREEKRYTQEVNDLIIDAVEELTCPVCDKVVKENTARHRLSRGDCPQCGRERPLEELKENLSEKVDNSDDVIEELEETKDELLEEKNELEDEIEELQSQDSDLSNLNDLTKLTLEEHDYDIDAVSERTEEELETYRTQVDELTTKQNELENEIEEIEEELSTIEDSISDINDRIESLTEDSFNEIILSFQDSWTENYQGMARDFGLEIRIEPDGSILLPGNEGARTYGELSTGESRLLNLSFALTVAEAVKQSDTSEDCLETLVLDEPFANLDEEKRQTAISFLKDSELQIIITSANEDLQPHFESEQIESLETMSVQLTWSDIDE